MITVRVASFNIRTSFGMDGRNHWLLRRRSCLEAVRRLDADVVGMQEVRPGQFHDLRRGFAEDTVVGAGRDAGGGGEHAAVLVRHGDWRVESSETRWLSPTPDVPGSLGWGAEHPRVVTLVRLTAGPHRLGIANTHLDHSRAAAREQGARLLLEWLHAESDRPWVITGDLNAQPDDAPVRSLVDAGFADTLADADPANSGTEHGFTGDTDRTRIDFVLAGPGVEPISARVDHTRPHNRLPSDHWPVVADLRLT